MATKKKSKVDHRAENRAAKERHIETLFQAHLSGGSVSKPEALRLAVETYAELHAVVRAVIEGVQRDHNTREEISDAVAAAARVIRRRG